MKKQIPYHWLLWGEEKMEHPISHSFISEEPGDRPDDIPAISLQIRHRGKEPEGSCFVMS
jgi:hypothetical protein